MCAVAVTRGREAAVDEGWQRAVHIARIRGGHSDTASSWASEGCTTPVRADMVQHAVGVVDRCKRERWLHGVYKARQPIKLGLQNHSDRESASVSACHVVHLDSLGDFFIVTVFLLLGLTGPTSRISSALR